MTPPRPALLTIAEWASSVRSFSARARHAARRVLLDPIGISLAGASRDPAPALRAVLAGPSGEAATVWSRPSERGFAPKAALVNRALADPLELTAGPEVAAAAVAAAELSDARFGDVLDSIVVAAEVEDYLRTWLQLAVETHGLHPPAVFGAAAAATTAGRLLALDTELLAGGLAAALSLAPASPYAAFSGGAAGKYLYGAWSQMLGVSCALFAARGVTGAPTTLDGARGFAQAFLDAGGAVPAPRFEPTGTAIERVTFKPYPCSRACHPALSALEQLGRFDPGAIERVEIESYPFSVELERRVRSESPIAWQMSVSRTVALALATGGIDVDSYTHANLNAPVVGRLRQRTFVRELESHGADALPRRREARVRIMLSDGAAKEATSAAKWGPEAPATDDELRERYRRFAGQSALGESDLDPWECGDDVPVRQWLAAASHG